EFARAPGFSDPESRERIPDPNDPATFETSRWTEGAPDAAEWRAFITEHLAVRRRRLTPRLLGARGLGAEAIGNKAVLARWRLGDGAVLTLAANLDETPVDGASFPAHAPLLGSRQDGEPLNAFTTLAWITP
ncbi:MAG: DUF3459 domain-containing protein, partial [Caulobacteraceae bacterium]|nr:DUF3459 domain-containing protein [Caulobacteraceae bacterium]